METLELFLLGFAGVLLHFLTKAMEARKAKIKLDYVLEGIASAISIIIVFVFVYAREDLKTLWPMTMVTTVVLGYSAQSIFRAIIKQTQPKGTDNI